MTTDVVTHTKIRIAFITGVFLPGVLMLAILMVDLRTTVVSTQDVGEIVSSEFLQGITENKTRVVTTRGTFLVNGTFQAFKGNGASLEVRRNNKKYLCDTTTKTCNWLE